MKSKNQLQEAALKNHTRPSVDSAVVAVLRTVEHFQIKGRPENGTEGLSQWKTCCCFASDRLWQKLTSSPTYNVIDRRFVLHLLVFFSCFFFFFLFEKACSFQMFSISGLFYLTDAWNKFTRLEKTFHLVCQPDKNRGRLSLDTTLAINKMV